MPSFGWRPDPYDTRDWPLAASALRAAPAHAAVGAGVTIEVMDQGAMQSCVAHAISYAARALGFASNLSRLFVYWNARHYHGETRSDAGTFLRTAIKSLASLGFCPEDVWPYSPALVLERPPLAAYQRAYRCRRAFAYRRIEETGSARCDAIRRALASHRSVVFGTRVPKKFVGGDEYLVTPPSVDEIGGGHALTLLAYDGNTFIGPNSWGPTWGRRQGWFVVTAPYLEWVGTRDLWTLELA